VQEIIDRDHPREGNGNDLRKVAVDALSARTRQIQKVELGYAWMMRMSVVRVRGDARLLLQQQSKLMKIDRLGQEVVESCLPAEFTILIRCAPSQRHRLHHAQTSLRLRHQIECVAIGQADIAQQNLKWHFSKKIGGFFQIAGNGNRMSAMNQKFGNDIPALAVIF